MQNDHQLHWYATRAPETAMMRTPTGEVGAFGMPVYAEAPANMAMILCAGDLTISLNSGVFDFERQNIIVPAHSDGNVTLRMALEAVNAFYEQPITRADVDRLFDHLRGVDEYETLADVEANTNNLYTRLGGGGRWGLGPRPVGYGDADGEGDEGDEGEGDEEAEEADIAFARPVEYRRADGRRLRDECNSARLRCRVGDTRVEADPGNHHAHAIGT